MLQSTLAKTAIWLVLVLFGLAVAPRPATAQTDEIQVYNAEIAEPGVLNLTLHNNYTPDGLRTPAFPGAVVSNQSLNGVPEFAYGVTKWFEAGLYLPLYSLPSDGRAELDGFKLRALFVAPDAAKQSVFYGVNFEFSFNARHWDVSRYTSEIRPIVGWRFGKIDLIFNPILDNSYKGLSRRRRGSRTTSRTNGRSPPRRTTISARCNTLGRPGRRPTNCSVSSTSTASRSMWSSARGSA